MSKEEAARRARAARKHKKEIARINEIALARSQAREEGYQAGKRDGATAVRGQVLEHAGNHYKAANDVQASAVRVVYRDLIAMA